MAGVAGNWQLVMDTPMGKREPKLLLNVDGSSVSGTFTGQMGATNFTGGALVGDKVTFTMQMAAMGQTFAMSFSADIQGDSLKGEVSSPRGSMPITGTRIAG